MTLSHENKMIVKKPLKDIMTNVVRNLDDDGWHLSFSDKLGLKDGEEVYELFGVSPSFSGSTVLSLWRHGARNVPFFLRIRSIKNETEIIAIAGGSESVFGTDWGRNKNIAEILFRFCTKKPKSSS